MVLVDTSSWIEALRKDGRADVQKPVEKLLIEGDVVACELVWLELWNIGYDKTLPPIWLSPRFLTSKTGL